MKLCPNCGNQAADKAIFCDQCGARLPAEMPIIVEQPIIEPEETPMSAPMSGGIPEGVVICPSCGAENVPGEIFCDLCGEPLEIPAPVEVTAEVFEEEPVVGEAIVEAVVEEALEEPLLEVVPEEATIGRTFCAVCGSPIHAGDLFCSSCGAALGKTAVKEEPLMEEPIPFEPAAMPAEETLVIEEVVAEETAPEQVAPAMVCPVCGSNITAGQRFCGSCGAALAAATVAEPIEPEAVVVSTGPYLEVVKSGAQIPLVLQPRLLVGRLDEVSGIEPEVDMTPHGGLDGGVSRRHAHLLYENGAWFVFDLDSTNGTRVNGKEIAPKTRVPLQDGARIEFGEVEVILHLD